MGFAPLWHVLVAAPIVLGGVRPSLAQDYPAREIHTICPFAPGTGADIIVRFYASKLAEIAGKPVITENRAGAQGLLGTEAVAHAKPDGYTISINPVASTMAAAPYIFKHLSFDPLKDFEFGGTLMSVSFVLVVSPNTDIRTVADLTKYLKEKKTDKFYGGSTNTGIVASELYTHAIGVDVKRVNYRSAFDAMNEMTSGRLDFYFTDITTALGQIAAGRYRPLAVTGTKRSAALPNVPTMNEAGVPMDFAPWWGTIMPAGTPKPIVAKLAGWLEAVSAMPETRAFLAKNGLDPLPGDAAMLRALLIKDTARWGEWVRLAQIEPQ